MHACMRLCAQTAWGQWVGHNVTGLCSSESWCSGDRVKSPIGALWTCFWICVFLCVCFGGGCIYTLSRWSAINIHRCVKFGRVHPQTAVTQQWQDWHNNVCAFVCVCFELCDIPLRFHNLQSISKTLHMDQTVAQQILYQCLLFFLFNQQNRIKEMSSLKTNACNHFSTAKQGTTPMDGPQFM